MGDYEGDTKGTARIGPNGSGEDIELDGNEEYQVKAGKTTLWGLHLFGTWEVHDIGATGSTGAGTLKMGFPASGTIPTPVEFDKGLHFNDGCRIKRTSAVAADRASVNFS